MYKAIFSAIIVIGSSLVGFAQTVTNVIPKETTQQSESAFFLGINSGLDYDMAYTLGMNTDNDYKYLRIKPRYNIGFDIGIKASKKVRARLEMKFVNVEYRIKFVSTLASLGQTVMNINYFDFNFHLDYLLLTKSKLQLFISPAVKYEYEIGETVGGNNYNLLNLDHPSTNIGGAIAGIAKYNFNKHFGVTFTPEYTCFFNSFASGINKPYQRFSTNLGFELTF